MLFEVCATTVQSQERFAQTGTGWVLRELSLTEQERVKAFVERNLERFSSEGLRYAVEKMPPEVKEKLITKHRERLRTAP